MQNSFFCLILLVAGVALPPTAWGVDVASLKGHKCHEKHPTPVQIDEEWVGGVGSWNLVAGTQLHVFYTAADVGGLEVAALSHDDLYYHSCLRFLWEKDATIVTGFGGKRADVRLTSHPDEEGRFSFSYPSLGLDGQATVVLTDDATFIMFYVCWPEEGEASWAVISPEPKLPKATLKKIRKEAEALGFKADHATTLRFDSCEADEAAAAKDEL